MSVVHKKEKQNKAGELINAIFQSVVISDRASGANFISDEKILSSTDFVVYLDWAPGQDYVKGEILKDSISGLYFEVIDTHKSNEAYPLDTTFAYYRLIELDNEGSINDPIPYPETNGIVVNVVNKKFYIYKGEIYKAAADMPNCIYPPDTVGLWQWEKIDK